MIILDTHIWVRWLEPQQQPLAPNLIDQIETADRIAVSLESAFPAYSELAGKLIQN